MVYAIFDDEARAAKAVDELVESDFTLEHICVLMREGPPHSNVTELPVDVTSKVARGVKVGTALGAVGGALVASTGGLIVAGPLLALVQGAVGGGAAGFLAGFVGGLGNMRVEIDDQHDHFPDEALLVGVMIVRRERVRAAREALLRAGAREVHVREKAAATHELGEIDSHTLSMPPREPSGRELQRPGVARAPARSRP